MANSINTLGEDDKANLANTITSYHMEPPEMLNSYVKPELQKYTESSVLDCALKNVEVAELSGYASTEAAAKNYGKSYSAASDIVI